MFFNYSMRGSYLVPVLLIKQFEISLTRFKTEENENLNFFSYYCYTPKINNKTEKLAAIMQNVKLIVLLSILHKIK